MHLSADLVVLSACNSALGREVKGEGVMGLSRAFFFAGARRVVSSLWKVDDEVTSELMAIFYEEMLRNGNTPSAALHYAQMKIAQQNRWKFPYYWAPFVLQGDWR
jgi:CHAT domain-containing protein